MKQQQCFMEKCSKKAEQTAKETFEKELLVMIYQLLMSKKIKFFWGKYY